MSAVSAVQRARDEAAAEERGRKAQVASRLRWALPGGRTIEQLQATLGWPNGLGVGAALRSLAAAGVAEERDGVWYFAADLGRRELRPWTPPTQAPEPEPPRPAPRPAPVPDPIQSGDVADPESGRGRMVELLLRRSSMTNAQLRSALGCSRWTIYRWADELRLRRSDTRPVAFSLRADTRQQLLQMDWQACPERLTDDQPCQLVRGHSTPCRHGDVRWVGRTTDTTAEADGEPSISVPDPVAAGAARGGHAVDAGEPRPGADSLGVGGGTTRLGSPEPGSPAVGPAACVTGAPVAPHPPPPVAEAPSGEEASPVRPEASGSGRAAAIALDALDPAEVVADRYPGPLRQALITALGADPDCDDGELIASVRERGDRLTELECEVSRLEERLQRVRHVLRAAGASGWGLEDVVADAVHALGYRSGARQRADGPVGGDCG